MRSTLVTIPLMLTLLLSHVFRVDIFPIGVCAEKLIATLHSYCIIVRPHTFSLFLIRRSFYCFELKNHKMPIFSELVKINFVPNKKIQNINSLFIKTKIKNTLLIFAQRVTYEIIYYLSNDTRIVVFSSKLTTKLEVTIKDKSKMADGRSVALQICGRRNVLNGIHDVFSGQLFRMLERTC